MSAEPHYGISLLVIEFLQPVITWHQQGLLPFSPRLTTDHRCRLVEGDFFALAGSQDGFDSSEPGRKFDAILVDIDHSPDALLDERSREFYQPKGLTCLANHLRPGGIFGLWSNDKPSAEFTTRLTDVFDAA